MGATGSSELLTPEHVYSDVMASPTGMACTDEATLFIGDGKTIEVRQLSGQVQNRTLNLQPVSCCSTFSGGFIIGFQSGQITEFDKEMNVITSYRQKCLCHAHEGEVTYVSNIFTKDPAGCHLISYGADNSLCLWNRFGHQIFRTNAKPTFITTSEVSVFYLEQPKQINIIDIAHLSVSTLKVTLPVMHIAPIADGIGALICLDNGCVSVISTSAIIAQFEFPELNKAIETLPLTVEGPTGLITYAAKDTEGQITLRALDEVLTNFGEAPSQYSLSPSFVVAGYSDVTRVFRIGDLESASMIGLPELDLPRTDIAQFLLKH